MGMRGTNDSSRLQWLVTTAKSVINPSFIVVTGDLTDSTNGNLLGIPNGPYQAEWDQYKSILTKAGVTADFYYDLPGNHDAYSDSDFSYYLANSVQGRATRKNAAVVDREFSVREVPLPRRQQRPATTGDGVQPLLALRGLRRPRHDRVGVHQR